MLALGLGGAAAVIAGGVTGVELISHRVLPGKALLDNIDGACSVPAPPLKYAPPGPSYSGAFYFHARRRSVGYTIPYPPGHRPGGALPLVVMLHGFGGSYEPGGSPACPLRVSRYNEGRARRTGRGAVASLADSVCSRSQVSPNRPMTSCWSIPRGRSTRRPGAKAATRSLAPGAAR